MSRSGQAPCAPSPPRRCHRARRRGTSRCGAPVPAHGPASDRAAGSRPGRRPRCRARRRHRPDRAFDRSRLISIASVRLLACIERQRWSMSAAGGGGAGGTSAGAAGRISGPRALRRRRRSRGIDNAGRSDVANAVAWIHTTWCGCCRAPVADRARRRGRPDPRRCFRNRRNLRAFAGTDASVPPRPPRDRHRSHPAHP